MLSTSLCLFLSGASLAEPISFSNAWQRLQENNDGLEASLANRDSAQYMQEAARSLYMPKIDINGAYTRLDEQISLSPNQLFDSMPAGDQLKQYVGQLGASLGIPPEQLNPALTSSLTEPDVVSASLNAVWPIYSGGRISAAQDIALGQFNEADYQLRIKQQALFEQLAKTYFGVVLAKQVLEAKVDAEKGLFKHLDFAIKLEQQGQIARVERLKAEASYDRASVATKKSRRDLEIAQLALNRLLKSINNTEPSSPLFTNPTLPELQSTTDATLENHPGLGVLESKRLQAEGLLKANKGNYLPEVAAFGNYRLYKEDTLAAELAPDWVVGIGMSIPITSRSGRSGKAKAVQSTLTKIDFLKAQATQDLSLLVEKTWREAETALEEYTGLASSLELAKENIRMREIAFAQGLSTSLEVIDAELFQVSVKTQRQAAAYQYVVSLARLLALSDQIDNFSGYQGADQTDAQQ